MSCGMYRNSSGIEVRNNTSAPLPDATETQKGAEQCRGVASGLLLGMQCLYALRQISGCRVEGGDGCDHDDYFWCWGCVQ